MRVGFVRISNHNTMQGVVQKKKKVCEVRETAKNQLILFRKFYHTDTCIWSSCNCFKHQNFSEQKAKTVQVKIVFIQKKMRNKIGNCLPKGLDKTFCRVEFEFEFEQENLRNHTDNINMYASSICLGGLCCWKFSNRLRFLVAFTYEFRFYFLM